MHLNIRYRNEYIHIRLVYQLNKYLVIKQLKVETYYIVGQVLSIQESLSSQLNFPPSAVYLQYSRSKVIKHSKSVIFNFLLMISLSIDAYKHLSYKMYYILSVVIRYFDLKLAGSPFDMYQVLNQTYGEGMARSCSTN